MRDQIALLETTLEVHRAEAMRSIWKGLKISAIVLFIQMVFITWNLLRSVPDVVLALLVLSMTVPLVIAAFCAGIQWHIYVRLRDDR